MPTIKCACCLCGRPWECASQGECSHDSVDNFSSDPADNLPEYDSGSDMVGSATGPNIFTGESDGDYSGKVSNGNRAGVPVREVNTYKDDSTIRDQQSTGRKRAAVMYPIDREADCEWARQTNCGGGNSPIVGCTNGKQQARHHGPDKNTLNNEAGNVHRICHTCHNRWHARNDEGYVWGSVYQQHSPSTADLKTLLDNEASWANVQLKKVVD